MRKILTTLVVLAIVTFSGITGRVVGQKKTTSVRHDTAFPVFEVDASWPKLPNNWVIGDPSSIAVDRRDNVWILHRPRTVPADKTERAAPPALEFDAAG